MLDDLVATLNVRDSIRTNAGSGQGIQSSNHIPTTRIPGPVVNDDDDSYRLEDLKRGAENEASHHGGHQSIAIKVDTKTHVDTF